VLLERWRRKGDLSGDARSEFDHLALLRCGF
jgi:hypothetical protein